MPWSDTFPVPIAVPDGRLLKTLRDAAPYITTLPKSQQDAPAWQNAIHVLIQAADSGGPIEFARLGMTQAPRPKLTPVYHSVAGPKWRNRYTPVRDR